MHPKLELTPQQQAKLDEIQARGSTSSVRMRRPQPRPPSTWPTYREVEVLALLADGLTHAEIGKRLFISPETTRTHLAHFRRKVGARNVGHAVAIAFRLGLIE